MTARSRAGVGRGALVGLLGLGALTGCAETTVDTVPTTAPAVATASTTVPTGSTDDLLERLVTEAGGLSERIVEHEGDDEALARMEALWAAIRPELGEAHPDRVEAFEDAMGYARRAVERRRPADADKAANQLGLLIAAL